MPLESLSQPFNPDEPGRKLREVQVEREPEKELAAKDQYKRTKEAFFHNDQWYAFVSKIPKAELRPGSLTSYVLSLVEQELGNPTSQSSEYHQTFEEDEGNPLRWHPKLVLHEIRKNPELARRIWEKNNTETYEYLEQEGVYINKSDRSALLGGKFNLNMIFTQSLFDPEDAKKKLSTLKRFYGVQEGPAGSWADVGYNMPAYDLLTVLIESSFDIVEAKAHYQEITRLRAYDPDSSFWKLSEENAVVVDDYNLEAQLYDILLHIRFEKNQKSAQDLSRRVIIPEERNF